MALNTNELIVFFRGYAPSSLTTEYTVPSGKQAIVKSVDLCNTDTVARTVSLRLGGTSDDYANLIDFPLAAKGEAASKYERDPATIVLEEGDVIQVGADAASKVAVAITGILVTL